MDFLRLFEQKTIDLDVDLQFAQYANYDISQIPTTMTFRLWELLFALGSFKSKYNNPSFRNKLFDFYYIIEKVLNTPDFRLSVTNIIQRFSSEELGRYSEDLGEAFAILITWRLYNTNLDRISRIQLAGRRIRADYRALSDHNHTLIFEAKGTTNIYTHTSQQNRGKVQIQQHQGFIKSVFCSLFDEHNSSLVKIIDPPGEEEPVSKREVMYREAISLSQQFHFLGHKELSRYLKLMARKINDPKRSLSHFGKERLFEKIKADYEEFTFKGQSYLGHITKYNNKYVFVGIRKNLIYFQDFVESRSKDDMEFFEREEAVVYRNKILVKQVHKLAEFDKKKVNYQDYIGSITDYDFHYYNDSMCRNLIIEILSKNGFKYLHSLGKGKMLIFRNKRSGKLNSVYYKKYFSSDKTFINKDIRENLKISRKEGINNFVLVTPNYLKDMKYNSRKLTRIIDREALRDCLGNHDLLLKYFI